MRRNYNNTLLNYNSINTNNRVSGHIYAFDIARAPSVVKGFDVFSELESINVQSCIHRITGHGESSRKITGHAWKINGRTNE